MYNPQWKLTIQREKTQTKMTLTYLIFSHFTVDIILNMFGKKLDNIYRLFTIKLSNWEDLPLLGYPFFSSKNISLIKWNSFWTNQQGE